jgi:hypothetical protein
MERERNAATDGALVTDDLAESLIAIAEEAAAIMQSREQPPTMPAPATDWLAQLLDVASGAIETQSRADWRQSQVSAAEFLKGLAT